MHSIAKDGIGFPILLAYGLIILLYLIILRLMLNALQQLGEKHRYQKTVVDADIHRTMNDRIERSMDTFDIYSMAIVIAKGGIAAVAMAAIIILLTLKVGIIATILVITGVVLCLWTANRWLRSQEKAMNIRGEIHKYAQKFGSMGMIIVLSGILVVLLFAMVWIT